MERNLENADPEPENSANMTIQKEWDANYRDRNYWNWWPGNNYWAGSQVWNQNPAPAANGKGSFAKGESQNPGGRTPRIDHGGKVYRDIDWGLKPTKCH